MNEEGTFITWNEHLSVDVEELDVQHKELIKIINRLYDVAQSDGEASGVAEIFNELLEYTQMHFAYEENLFRNSAYPDIAGHDEQHVDLINQLLEIQQGIKAGERAVNAGLLNFLKRWLQNHILVVDKPYTPYLLEAGVK